MYLRKICVILLSIAICSSSISTYASSQNQELGEAPVITAPDSDIKINAISSSTTIKHDNTIDEVVTLAKQLPTSMFVYYNPPQYTVQPDISDYTDAGDIEDSYIEDAINGLKMVRYIAGIPYENVEFSDEFNNYSQHGATLMAGSLQFSHYPTQPANCSDVFFESAYKGCNEANIAAGLNNISAMVLGFMQDPGESNFLTSGHRRWLLCPDTTGFGIGYTYSNYGYGFGSIYVRGTGYSYGGGTFDSYIAWPSAGAFPLEYFTGEWDSGSNSNLYYPWSVNLGESYGVPERENIEITLTRFRNNEENTVWIMNKDTPSDASNYENDNAMHLSVDDLGYGLTKAIIFRPDPATLGEFKAGDVFTVEISGLTDSTGQSTTLSYEIDLFDLSTEINRSDMNFNVKDIDGSPMANIELNVNGETYVTDDSGCVSLRVDNNAVYEYTVKAEGYSTVTGSVSVAEEGITETITLSEAKFEIFTDIIYASNKVTTNVTLKDNSDGCVLIMAAYQNEKLVSIDLEEVDKDISACTLESPTSVSTQPDKVTVYCLENDWDLLLSPVENTFN